MAKVSALWIEVEVLVLVCEKKTVEVLIYLLYLRVTKLQVQIRSFFSLLQEEEVSKVLRMYSSKSAGTCMWKKKKKSKDYRLNHLGQSIHTRDLSSKYNREKKTTVDLAALIRLFK